MKNTGLVPDTPGEGVSWNGGDMERSFSLSVKSVGLNLIFGICKDNRDFVCIDNNECVCLYLVIFQLLV